MPPKKASLRPIHPPHRVLIAPDKFKGTLTAGAAARAIAKGLRRAWPKVKTTSLPLSDGGEGFVELLVRHTGGRLLNYRTIGATGQPCGARWGILGMGTGRTAVIGLNEASGLAQLPPAARNPEITTNLGTGRLIAHAMSKGCREILIGIGGSATTEGGISLAAATGYRFLDAGGKEIVPNGAGLARLARIEAPPACPRPKFIVATDVDNPLCGAKGAARQFAPQKGADAAMVTRLEKNLCRLASIVERDLGIDFSREEGAGAAGGCGYGLMTFFGARRENGFQMVRRLTKLDASIRAHDLVITGEGSFDRTSLLGKAPAQLGSLARKLKRPVWALCGQAKVSAAKSPFDRLGALSTKKNPGPPPDKLSSAQHARRLEELAYRMALGED